MKKFVLVVVMLALSCNVAFAASNVKVWRAPSLNVSSLKKIFVVPLVLNLKAGNDMMSDREFMRNLYDWTIKGIRTTPQGKKLIIKTVNEMYEELVPLYKEPPQSVEMFLERAYENGYEAFVCINMTQEFTTEYVPEKTFDYTTYKNIYVKARTDTWVQSQFPRITA